jgi:hypothetical protein
MAICDVDVDDDDNDNDDGGDDHIVLAAASRAETSIEWRHWATLGQKSAGAGRVLWWIEVVVTRRAVG